MSGQRSVLFNVLEEYPDYCIMLDEDGIILSANKAYLGKVQKKSADVIGQRFETMLYDAAMLNFEHAFIDCLEEMITKSFDCMFTDDDGERFDVSVFMSPQKSKVKNSAKQVLIIAKDITSQKKNEVDLLRFYYVAENTVNPLQITDLSGKMIYVNPAFVKASGYSREELLGKDPKVFSSLKHSSAFWDDMWRTIASGKVWVGEVENTRKTGEAFYTQLLISPIVNSEQKVIGYFGIHRDLHEKRNLEKQLMHTQKMESIGTLAAGVAHEVGNPLASISALVQIIQRQTQDDFIKEKMELVKKQITRISKIIRDLVDFSRPSNYEMKLTDINDNVRESIEIVKVGKKAKDIDFIMDLDRSLVPLHLVSDQIQQVFVNILINAVDAILEKKATVGGAEKGRIRSSTMFKDNRYVIIFEDNGIGLKEENVSKIFEPFFTTKTEGKGTGLGLWVSYGIIKSFQGEIQVDSKYYEWTRFTIYLPVNPSF
ncbi:MAG: PAS domain S-box protein [Ignavibacteria bacterium]|nr:PAS domain S-box protein [Ignavibacteria bacterium]